MSKSHLLMAAALAMFIAVPAMSQTAGGSAAGNRAVAAA